MKEADIRDLDYVTDFFEMEKEWISQFLGEDGIVRKELTVNVNCPCCDASSGERLFTKDGFHYDTCHTCMTIYVNPRFNHDVMDSYYRERNGRVDYGAMLNSDRHRIARLHEIFSPRVNLIKNEVERRGGHLPHCRILDVGCASGQFLRSFEEGDCPALFGVEADQGLAGIARADLPGANIFASSFERFQVKEPSSFDIITLWEVLEHVFDPFVVMDKVRSLLKPDGLVFLSVPNVDGFDIRILWDKGNAFSAPSHLNYFSKSSIHRLFDRCGLNVRDIITPGKLDVDIVRNRLEISADIELRLGSYWKQIMTDDSDQGDVLRGRLQSFLSDNGLSSHMVVCAELRKK